MENTLKLQSPWVSYARKINALFEKDPEVAVDWNDATMELKLYVDSQEKAEALDKLLKHEIEFGNVKMTVTVIPANIVDRTMMNLFETAFKGNPAVSYTKSIDAMGFSSGYIVFKPEVVQYFNDDLTDINGLASTLYEDLANDVFEEHAGVNFCTDIVNQAFLGKPLGEWP